MHELERRLVERLPPLIHSWHGIDCHRIRNRVLHYVADRPKQCADHIPGFRRHDGGHCFSTSDQCRHDPKTSGQQSGSEANEPAFPAPQEIDEMSDRHLECPGDAGPKSQRGEERGRETEVVLDEKGSDDPGETRNPVGHVDHQRRQIGEPHLTAERKNVAVDPPGETPEHR